MSTLGTMKSEIAADLGRSDLTSYIAECISKAIEREQLTRYFFNVTDALEITTSDGTAAYSTFSSGPITNVVDMVRIDHVWRDQGGLAVFLREIGFDETTWDNAATAKARPWAYSWYADKIHFTPIPDGTYTVKVSGHYKVAEPASDAETGNAWMTYAYNVILPLAKSIIYQSRIRNFQAAQADYKTYMLAKKKLIAEGTMKRGRVRIVPDVI